MQTSQSQSVNFSSRNKKIDILRGVAIVLVVLGHAIQVSINDFDNNVGFRIIYSFHMPLFMFLSGYVSVFSTPIKNPYKFIRKKFKSLIIPFLSWYFIVSLMVKMICGQNINLANYILSIFLSPDLGLWFLWVLFILFLILTITNKLEEKLGIFAVLGMVLLVRAVPFNILGLDKVKWYIPFFFLGYIASKYKSTLKKYDNSIFIISLIGFLCLVPFWYREIPPTFITLLNYHVSILYLFYKYIVAVLGIGVICFIVKSIHNTDIKLCKLLSYLGANSLAIYVIHWHLYFLNIIKYKNFMINNNLLDGFIIILSAILAIAVSLLLSKVIKKNKILRFLLLGII